MALVVEDGTGIANANSYVDATYVSTYLTERGRSTAWLALNDAQREAALIKATDYIDLRFSKLFIGSKLTTTQSLAWPREYSSNETDYGLVPTNLKKACAEYASRSMSAELLTDTPTGVVKRKKEKVGPIEEETEYTVPYQPASTSFLVTGDLIPVYPAADMLLEPLFKISKGAVAIR